MLRLSILFSIIARNRRPFQQLRTANPSGVPLFLLLLYYYYYCTKLDILLPVLDYIAGLVTNEHIITAINFNPSDCLSHSFERTPLQSVNLPVYHKFQRDTDSKIGERGLDADYLFLYTAHLAIFSRICALLSYSSNTHCNKYNFDFFLLFSDIVRLPVRVPF